MAVQSSPSHLTALENRHGCRPTRSRPPPRRHRRRPPRRHDHRALCRHDAGLATEPRYAEFAAELAARIDAAATWKELDDAFWTVIPFGTGGRRGRMYPIGSNAINDRTIGESAQGLADYVRSVLPAGETPTCAIAYDTRHRSEHFAELCTEMMLAAGFKVFFLRGYRSTPELSFAVRYTQSQLRDHGHRQPQSAQRQRREGLLGRRRAGAAAARQGDHRAGDAGRRDPPRAVRAGRGQRPGAVRRGGGRRRPSWRPCSSRRRPARGTSRSSIRRCTAWGRRPSCRCSRGAGFERLRVFGPHAQPDGDFPNVPGHVANPENPAVFDAMIAEAIAAGDDLVLASDPDCDRLGAAAPLTRAAGSRWRRAHRQPDLRPALRAGDRGPPGPRARRGPATTW